VALFLAIALALLLLGMVGGAVAISKFLLLVLVVAAVLALLRIHVASGQRSEGRPE
jgi:hypothetical protein